MLVSGVLNIWRRLLEHFFVAVSKKFSAEVNAGLVS